MDSDRVSAQEQRGLGFTIFIVDDDQSIHRALRRLLHAVGYNVRSFLSAEGFLAEQAPAASEHGCVLLDLDMPGMKGDELQRILANSPLKHPIVFLTGQGDVHSCAAAMKLGAVDFLTKPIDEVELFAAIENALQLDKSERAMHAARSEIERRMARLSPREREVLHLVVAGRLNKQIAAHLGISEKTIKVHRARVMNKMHARSVAELVFLVSQGRAAPERPFTARLEASLHI